MKDQHTMIKGYRDLSADEISLINDCKELGEKVGDLIELMQKIESLDQRNVAIARTQIQQGFMWLIRSIAQPNSFC